MRLFSFFYLFLHALLIWGQPPQVSYCFPYDLSQPDTVFTLTPMLEEVSGLSLGPDTSTLLAINDEEGVVYILNRHSGAVLGYKTFWKDGDYEGIEWVDSSLWIVKSNGKLYEVHHFEEDSLCTIKHVTPLNKENDVEGLGYDPSENRLLIAAKGSAQDSVRHFFSWTLEKSDIHFVPLFQIERSQLLNFVSKMAEGVEKEVLLRQFAPEEEKYKFRPSAIACHPVSGHYYILASAGKLLVVCNKKGEILHLQKLNKEQHRQPEGLCFAPDGTLYIGNEADGKKPKLQVFSMR